MLEIDKLVVKRGGQTLVRNVSFKALPGSLTAIVGPNGAGKTSVFKAICGEWPSAGGTIRIGGKPRHCWSRKTLAQRMAIMGQDPTLNFDFTVAELVQLGRAPYLGLGHQAKDVAIVDAVIAMSGLTSFKFRSVPSLSGGERQRSFFAKTLAQLTSKADTLPGEGCLMLLDEPTSALDLAQQAYLMQTIRAIVESGGCVVAVLHDLNLAGAFADQIVMMKNGMIHAQGSPEDVLTGDMVSNCYDCKIQIVKTGHTPYISLSG